MYRLLMIAGALIFLAGLVVWVVGRLFPGMGRLPGDIVIERENFTFYFPVMTSLLVSLGLSLIFWLLRRY